MTNNIKIIAIVIMVIMRIIIIKQIEQEKNYKYSTLNDSNVFSNKIKLS